VRRIPSKEFHQQYVIGIISAWNPDVHRNTLNLLRAFIQTNTAKPLPVVPERLVLSISKPTRGTTLCQFPHTKTTPDHEDPFSHYPPVSVSHVIAFHDIYQSNFSTYFLSLPTDGRVQPKVLPWFPTYTVLQMIGIAVSVQWLGYGMDWGDRIRFSTGTETFLFFPSIQTGSKALASNRHTRFATGVRTTVAWSWSLPRISCRG
jgi:hypothetical protein